MLAGRQVSKARGLSWRPAWRWREPDHLGPQGSQEESGPHSAGVGAPG